MKAQVRPLAAALCLTGLMMLPMLSWADEVVTTPSVEKKIHHKKSIKHKKQAVPASKIAAKSSETTQQAMLQGKPVEDLPIDLDMPGQAFVSTGPYVGIPLQYSGSNLIVNSPSVNTDVQLLKTRKEIDSKISNLIGSSVQRLPQHSHLLLSGVAEVQATADKISGERTTSDIDVTSVSLDAFFMGPSQWTLGFIELSYDNSPPVNNSLPGFRVSNSNVFVNKAFITLGDFSKSPFYATMGEYYVPFGSYSSVVLSDPLTKLIARTKARAFTLGYHEASQGLMASIYGFKGDTHIGSQSRVNNGGVNAAYRFDNGSGLSGDVGAGLIANLADSVGMQRGTGFTSNETLTRRVPAYDVRGSLHIGSEWDLLAELVSAERKFDANDMTFNGHGAKPWAVDVEAAYSFQVMDSKPSSVGVGYGRSQDALAMGLPRDRYTVAFNTSWWRYTMQGIEFRHDRNYGVNTTANGPQSVTISPACTAAICNGLGKSDNTVTAQFDYYF